MFSEEYYSWEMQAPAISNGVASESIDSWPAPVSPIADDGKALDQDPPGEDQNGDSDSGTGTKFRKE